MKNAIKTEFSPKLTSQKTEFFLTKLSFQHKWVLSKTEFLAKLSSQQNNLDFTFFVCFGTLFKWFWSGLDHICQVGSRFWQITSWYLSNHNPDFVGYTMEIHQFSNVNLEGEEKCIISLSLT